MAAAGTPFNSRTCRGTVITPEIAIIKTERYSIRRSDGAWKDKLAKTHDKLTLPQTLKKLSGF